ncbi:hypothetical protein T10_5512 [Trichinella papuae]|uniref:Uncharacterized protein n=1 Tax=Trichinella papuae TaxID=268474 RepID=A0A0V1M240_9BILA|nr:hypothetical protein T10_4187 [Trichinella papuae]KRZ73390.1 hypothetical protein T10_5512 [Trichinella papuae]
MSIEFYPLIQKRRQTNCRQEYSHSNNLHSAKIKFHKLCDNGLELPLKIKRFVIRKRSPVPNEQLTAPITLGTTTAETQPSAPFSTQHSLTRAELSTWTWCIDVPKLEPGWQFRAAASSPWSK